MSQLSYNQNNLNEQTIEIGSKKLPSIRQRLKQNSRLLPKEAVELMTQWYDMHYDNPYPTFRDCEILATNGKISIEQVKQWFVNVRRRTQNQFRKQRTSYNLKRKSSNCGDLFEQLQPSAKSKLDEQITTINNNISIIPVQHNQCYNINKNSSYLQNSNYLANYNYMTQAYNQYFDNSGHFQPSSLSFNNSYDSSNLSFDFSSSSSSSNASPATPANYPYYNLNLQYSSPIVYDKSTSQFSFNY